MAKRPKPPNIEPPKIVPGKETARSIGIDTAFIDGLAAGLVDENDLPPPPPAKKAAPVAKKPPPPKGLSERSGPLFGVQEPEKKTDEDPLAALLEDLPAEPTSASGGTFVPPTRKDDLLARLAAKDDDDGAVSLAPPPPPKKGASESSGAERLAKGSRSETSGNMPLPKGTDAPVFELGAKAGASAKGGAASSKDADAVAVSTSGDTAKRDASTDKGEAPKRDASEKPASEAAKPAAREPAAQKPRADREAPQPAIAGPAGVLDNLHPGMWFLLAAAIFGLFVPWIAGGGTGEHTPTKSDAARHVPPKKPGAPDRAPAHAVVSDHEEEEPEAAEEPEPEAEEAEAPVEAEAEAEAEEELVEIEEEPAAAGGEGKSKRKPDDAGGKEQKTASQLLNDAKTAYSQGRNGDAYRLASQSHRQRASEDALTVRAKAACRMGNEAAAKKAFDDLPMGAAKREVRPICRDKGIRLGI